MQTAQTEFQYIPLLCQNQKKKHTQQQLHIPTDTWANAPVL